MWVDISSDQTQQCFDVLFRKKLWEGRHMAETLLASFEGLSTEYQHRYSSLSAFDVLHLQAEKRIRDPATSRTTRKLMPAHGKWILKHRRLSADAVC